MITFISFRITFYEVRQVESMTFLGVRVRLKKPAKKKETTVIFDLLSISTDPRVFIIHFSNKLAKLLSLFSRRQIKGAPISALISSFGYFRFEYNLNFAILCYYWLLYIIFKVMTYTSYNMRSEHCLL